jgi:putative phosphoribosyl transferase
MAKGSLTRIKDNLDRWRDAAAHWRAAPIRTQQNRRRTVSPFADRREAGQMLSEELRARGFADPVVLALPRGGVPIGLEVARALRAPLDLVMVRKIGVPYQPELAAAAVVNGDEPQTVVNESIAREAGLNREKIDELAAVQLEEIKRRRAIYLKGRTHVPVAGRTAIVVDDGIATGATVRAALRGVRRRTPAKLVLAVPVAPQDTIDDLRNEVDEVICLEVPEFFYAIGVHYADFTQVSDQEVVDMLDEASEPRTGSANLPGRSTN